MRYFLALICSFAVFSVKAQQQKTEQITVDSISRRFVIYIPSISNTDSQLPLVISLHGRLGTGKGMMSFADFRALAMKEKFIIVCPDGINKSWNDGRPTPSQKKGINDIKFVDQLIDYFINTYHVDPKRVYVTGMSNGGFLASRLACELNKRIAAIAVVGASMDKGLNYKPTKALPVMYIQGTKDPLVPYEGGEVKGAAGGDVYGHRDILKLWAEADQCDGKPTITNLPDGVSDGTGVVKEEFLNSTTGIKVLGYTITNGGHTWPGGTQYLPKFLIGTVSHNLKACDIIWDFFKEYKLAD